MYENKVHRKIEYIIYTMDMLKLKNTISEVNSLYRNNSRLDTESNGISKSEAQD